MRMNVNDKTERLELGNIIELRGNFTAHETEDGTTYEADCYHTTNKTATFEQLHLQELKKDAQLFLNNTDYICTKCFERGLNVMQEYPDVCAKREAARGILRA